MKNKQASPTLSKIWLTVPSTFLQMFDEAVQNTFSSRSEAIRRGMNLVLDELRQYQNQAPAYSLPSANQFDQATTTTIQSGEEKGI